MKAVLVLSGGLDSSTLGYWLKSQGYDELICISFNYGQKQITELNAAKIIATKLNATHHIIDMNFIQNFLAISKSSLTNPNIMVPHGEYTQANMQSTVVPNRNSMFLTMAWTIASIEQADIIAYGAHHGDHYIYPDTRIDYLNALNLALHIGSEGSRKDNLNLVAPFINWSKTDIIIAGSKLNVPFELTWSCYDDCEIHCGLCGTCQERKKGFHHANIPDPTIYQK